MSIKYNVSGSNNIGRSAEYRLKNDYVVYGYPYYINGECKLFSVDSGYTSFVRKAKDTIYIDVRDMNNVKAYMYDVPNDVFVVIRGAIFDYDVDLFQSDWNIEDTTDIRYILNKPTSLSDFTNDVGYVTNSTVQIGWSNLTEALQNIINAGSELLFVNDDASYLIVNGYVLGNNYPILKHNGKYYFYSYKDSNDKYHFYSIDGDGRYVDMYNQWNSDNQFATVAKTGSYSDLINKPNLSVYAEKGSISYTDLSQQLKDRIDDADNVLADWRESDSTKDSFIKNKPDLDLYEEVISGNLVDKPVAIEYRFQLDSSSYIWKLYDGSTLLATFDMSNEDMLNSADTLKYMIENSDFYDTLVSDYHLAVSGSSTGIVAYSDMLELSLVLWNDWYDENEYPELWLTENSISRLKSGYPKGYSNYGDKTFALTGSSAHILPTNRKEDVVYIDKSTWSAWMWNSTTNSYEKLNPPDEQPTLNSTNSVSGGGVYEALGEIKDSIDELDKRTHRITEKEIQYDGNGVITPIMITDIPTDTRNLFNNGCLLLWIRGYVYDSGIRKPIDMLFAIYGNGTTIASTMVSRGGWMFPKTEFFPVTINGITTIGIRVSQIQGGITYGYLIFDIIDDDETNRSWQFYPNGSISYYTHGMLTETEIAALDTIVKRAISDKDGNIINNTYVKLVNIEDTPYREIINETNSIPNVSLGCVDLPLTYNQS